jgi:hypothetical protein
VSDKQRSEHQLTGGTMKVYAVIYCERFSDYVVEYHVRGVYSTQEKAQGYIDDLMAKWPDEESKSSIRRHHEIQTFTLDTGEPSL